ncbi:HU family DNA-binding protein [Pseudomonas capeferrum]|uniref:HU family DNA-binding protein n=1 Tax=Pseudomonas capeferrum TaxID=1495066 RepID=UPI0015E2F10D|nr:HU family DNA-binding protein [Pseudomonas capeferrum]MBA1204021.1 HU family DNA-binding protein [Pseudomonas capeferrum]
MRKPDLVGVIAEQTDLSKEKARETLDAILDSITKALGKKDSVTLVGFGTFEQRHRGARTGKNPQTGEPVKIKASNTVAFKPGKLLKETVNPVAKSASREESATPAAKAAPRKKSK